ncbi:MAG: hypothetical protein HC814_05555 [Rhodobacteraceae bacterium]|nr:hypothetical protein [Paracoccaceae bacterium]
MQIISRATHERNVPTLHRAGADLTLSYAVMGANTIFNLLHRSDTILMPQGINIFPVPVHKSIAGRKISDTDVRSRTGCTIISVETNGKRTINPPADFVLPDKGKMVLIGTLEAEEKFLDEFPPEKHSKSRG